RGGVRGRRGCHPPGRARLPRVAACDGRCPGRDRRRRPGCGLTLETRVTHVLTKFVDMADLFDGYPLGDGWDEMFAGAGDPRPAYSGLYAAVQPIDGEELAARADLLSQTYRDAGV